MHRRDSRAPEEIAQASSSDLGRLPQKAERVYPETAARLRGTVATRIVGALGSIPRSTQIMTAGLLLTTAVVFAQAVSQWIDFHYFAMRLRALDSDHHGSLFGSLSLLAEAVAAAAIGLRAIDGRRLAWLVVAGVVGVLVVPRALMRYEPVFARYDVLILVAPLTVIFVALCALTFRDTTRVRFMVWGALVLLTGSFVLHAVGPQTDATAATTYLATNTWTYQAAGMLKHGAELTGWMFLVIAMIAAVSPDMRGLACDTHHDQLPDPPTDDHVGLASQSLR